jgi:hypothetical protein
VSAPGARSRPPALRSFRQHCSSLVTSWRTLLAAAAGATLLASVPVTAQQSPRRPEPPAAIEVQARRIENFYVRDPDRKLFGALEFRGGIELTSPDTRFGGISAFRVAADGRRFLAVSDRGRWLRGSIAYRKDAPSGLTDVEMAPVLGADGRPLAARGWYDTESIAEDGGTVWLGIERVHRIVRFDYGKDGLLARGQPVVTPPEMKDLPSNKGIEALVAMPRGGPLGGALVAISEAGLDAAGNIKAFLIGGPSPGPFTVRRLNDFDISDAALLPPHHLLILERRFSYLSGIAMRIRRIPLAGIQPGALVDGAVLVEADLGYQIDNMEGLSVHRTAAGDTVLTLVSDDNFSPIQRTVLLQFTLAGP